MELEEDEDVEELSERGRQRPVVYAVEKLKIIFTQMLIMSTRRIIVDHEMCSSRGILLTVNDLK